MVSPNVERVLEGVNALTADERRQLLTMLNVAPVASSDEAIGDRVDRELVRQGLMQRVPPPPTEEDIAQYDAWRPIEVPGRPLSETLIEERR